MKPNPRTLAMERRHDRALWIAGVCCLVIVWAVAAAILMWWGE